MQRESRTLHNYTTNATNQRKPNDASSLADKRMQRGSRTLHNYTTNANIRRKTNNASSSADNVYSVEAARYTTTQPMQQI